MEDNYLRNMKCFLKNVPPINFSLKGSTGQFFPIATSCRELEQFVEDEIDCWLVKEEDGFTNIFTDRNLLIGVDCTDPIEAPCYLVCQELQNNEEILLLLAEVEDEYLLFCDGTVLPDFDFICVQEDPSIPILFDPYERKFAVT